MIKKRLGIPAVLAAGALGVLALRASGSARAQPESLQGVVEFETRLASFELPGRIVRRAVERGDRVGANTLLATIDDSLERASRSARANEASGAKAELELLEAGARKEDVSALAANVRAARATEELVQKKLQRERALYQSGVSPRAVVDELEGQLSHATAERQSLEQNLRGLNKGARAQEIEGARARMQAAEAVLSLEDVRLQRHELTAASPGTVLDVHVEQGEVVNAGTPVVTLADTSRPYVDVFVPQAELAGIRVGAHAIVRTDALPGGLVGRVEHVARHTEFTPRFLFSERERPNLVVRIRVRVDDKSERLHAGVPAFVTIQRQ